jgi:hypothetical protein
MHQVPPSRSWTYHHVTPSKAKLVFRNYSYCFLIDAVTYVPHLFKNQFPYTVRATFLTFLVQYRYEANVWKIIFSTHGMANSDEVLLRVLTKPMLSGLKTM